MMTKDSQNFGNSSEKEQPFSAPRGSAENTAFREKKNEDGGTEENSFKDQIEQARLQYARRYYEVNNTFSKLRSIFGKDLRTDPKEIGKTDATYDQYKKSLNEFKNFELARISEDASLTPEKRRKEMGSLIKFFDLEERINLYGAHGQAKAEAFEKRFGKFPG